MSPCLPQRRMVLTFAAAGTLAYGFQSARESALVAEMEFNGMTKYFYTDRSTPKKRLGPAEMAEINRLYRIIGALLVMLTIVLYRLRRSRPAGRAGPPTTI